VDDKNFSEVKIKLPTNDSSEKLLRIRHTVSFSLQFLAVPSWFSRFSECIFDFLLHFSYNVNWVKHMKKRSKLEMGTSY